MSLERQFIAQRGETAVDSTAYPLSVFGSQKPLDKQIESFSRRIYDFIERQFIIKLGKAAFPEKTKLKVVKSQSIQTLQAALRVLSSQFETYCQGQHSMALNHYAKAIAIEIVKTCQQVDAISITSVAIEAGFQAVHQKGVVSEAAEHKPMSDLRELKPDKIAKVEIIHEPLLPLTKPVPVASESSQLFQRLSQLHVAEIAWASIVKGEADLIGEGGYGAVYRGRFGVMELAIKTLKVEELAFQSLEHFKREAAVMMALQSKHTVEVIGVCPAVKENSSSYGIVMRYYAKGSLNDVLVKEALPWLTRWEIAIGIGEGLTHLHTNPITQIIHRDMKSPNVLLDEAYTPKIADFGTAKLLSERTGTKTKNNQVGSSLWWSAPESLDYGTHPTPAWDVYAYAMILWEISSRQRPFAKAKTDQQVTFAIMRNQIEVANPIPPECPQSYATQIRAGWFSVDKRPPAKEITEALKNAFATEKLKLI